MAKSKRSYAGIAFPLGIVALMFLIIIIVLVVILVSNKKYNNSKKSNFQYPSTKTVCVGSDGSQSDPTCLQGVCADKNGNYYPCSPGSNGYQSCAQYGCPPGTQATRTADVSGYLNTGNYGGGLGDYGYTSGSYGSGSGGNYTCNIGLDQYDNCSGTIKNGMCVDKSYLTTYNGQNSCTYGQLVNLKTQTGTHFSGQIPGTVAF